MHERQQDTMTYVRKFGSPDYLFITMTFNPNWPEIQNNLLPPGIKLRGPSKTTLTEFFALCQIDNFARTLLYVYIPEYNLEQ